MALYKASPLTPLIIVSLCPRGRMRESWRQKPPVDDKTKTWRVRWWVLAAVVTALLRD